MAYNENTKRTDSTNCVEHRWDRSGTKLVSTGVVTHHRCNNCLAMKITWSTDVLENGNWVTKSDTQIVEPKF